MLNPASNPCANPLIHYSLKQITSNAANYCTSNSANRTTNGCANSRPRTDSRTDILLVLRFLLRRHLLVHSLNFFTSSVGITYSL
ncbi:hypothetical protein BY02_24270 [Escherichia coli O121:H19 str. 2011C-3537]|nr:hypothetical protein BY02_24270 [Escherichia coli O121:H19 str. 2011C-3537]